MGGRTEQVAGLEVEPRRIEQGGLEALAVERFGELLTTGAVGCVHCRHQLLGATVFPQPLQQAERVGDQDPA